MNNNEIKKHKYILYSVAAFIAVIAVTIIAFFQLRHSQEEKAQNQMSYIASTISSETYEMLHTELSKARILEAYLLSNKKVDSSFDAVAATICDDPVVRNVLFAPKGIVSTVYPLEGNEATIGFNMNSSSAGNKEVQEAINRNDLYLAGPFELVQGGYGISGRLPVTIDGKYWGIVSVTLKYPEVLNKSSIKKIEKQGYACKIWRINPDSGQKQTIIATDSDGAADGYTYNMGYNLMYSKWNITITSLKPWYQNYSLLSVLVVGLILSIVCSIIVYNLFRIRELKKIQHENQIQFLQQSLENERNNMMLSQISSHFFYHTLNAMQALIIIKPESAYKMCGDFARYLRFNVDSLTAYHGLGKFKEEMRAVKAYVDINKAQLGDRLKVNYNYDENIDFTIPLLTIQPIVENAILHGIKQKIGGGTIDISIEESETHYIVTVVDDGVGFIKGHQKGYGATANVKKRLAAFENCSCETQSEPSEGTTVVIKYCKESFKNVDEY